MGKSSCEVDILKSGPKLSSLKPLFISKKISLNSVGKAVKLIFEKFYLFHRVHYNKFFQKINFTADSQHDCFSKMKINCAKFFP
jgi:hypothetical protein